MLVAPVRDTATVRVTSFEPWALALVVIPLAIVTMQGTLAASTVVSAEKMTAAFDRPEFSNVGTKVVVPQPLVLGVARLANPKPGSTILMVSSNDREAVSTNS
jgi:hypothetical protein